ncbi:hypothetical protein PTKIN_Ptkin07bG0083800 [Pterospermum kingtungense]
MGESTPRPSTSTSTSTFRDEAAGTPSTPSTPKAPTTPSQQQPFSLVQPSQKIKKHKPKVVRVFRSVFRSFPIINPACKFPSLPVGLSTDSYKSNSGTKVTGTLFGCRKGRVSLSVQESPNCLPSLVIELAIQTNVLQKELGAGMVRIALECEKRGGKDRVSLLDEPLWTMYCNGKKTGHVVKREATEEDLNVMELLKAVSMGAGVLPGPANSETEGVDGELTYIRAYFDRVVGSRDSETFYMLSPDGNNAPELRVEANPPRRELGGQVSVSISVPVPLQVQRVKVDEAENGMILLQPTLCSYVVPHQCSLDPHFLPLNPITSSFSKHLTFQYRRVFLTLVDRHVADIQAPLLTYFLFLSPADYFSVLRTMLLCYSRALHPWIILLFSPSGIKRPQSETGTTH